MTRTMISVNIDRSEACGLSMIRFAGEIRRAIAEGEAEPGERLPLAKDLGSSARSQQEHSPTGASHPEGRRAIGQFQRGRGITVAGSLERGLVVTRIHSVVEFCRSYGYRPDEVIQIIEGLPVTFDPGKESSR